jgi:hypothetical protein
MSGQLGGVGNDPDSLALDGVNGLLLLNSPPGARGSYGPDGRLVVDAGAAEFGPRGGGGGSRRAVVVGVLLDMAERTLQFSVGGRELGVAFSADIHRGLDWAAGFMPAG